MTEFSTVMAVFNLLEKSNCRKCYEKTCLAFAARVFKGERAFGECPELPDAVRKAYAHATGRRPSRIEQDHDAMISRLKSKLLEKDFRILAEAANAAFEQDRLTLRVLGKPLSIDRSGRIFSDIHANPWLFLAVLDYLLQCKGLPLSGRWVSFRELEGAGGRTALFARGADSPNRRPDAGRHVPSAIPGILPVVR